MSYLIDLCDVCDNIVEPDDVTGALWCVECEHVVKDPVSPSLPMPAYVERPRSIDLTQLTPTERAWFFEAKAQMDADLDAAESRS